MKHVSLRFSNSFIIEKFNHLKQIIEDAAITARHVPTYFITVKIHISLLRESNQQIHVFDDNIHALSYDLQEVRLLKTIPGIADDLAAVIASDIGDINRFKNAKALVAY